MRKIELEDQSKLGPYQATEAELAAIEEGLKSGENGRRLTIDQVRENARRRYAAWKKVIDEEEIA